MEKARVDPVADARWIICDYIARNVLRDGRDVHGKPARTQDETWHPRDFALVTLCVLSCVAVLGWGFEMCH